MANCASCEVALPEGARFCPACGARVEASLPAGEMLKLVTVLFADVVGSTARAEGMHPEDTRALMSDYFAAMSEEIRAEGGTIEKFVGDAIMAVFGVPVAHEDDAVRAIRAARRMLDRLARWNASRPTEQQLAIRIGINTGDVITAAEPEADLLVTGDAVNVAARLEQAAGPGQVLVGERTARLAGPWFELSPVEPLVLKGKSGAVAAWDVGAAREAVEPRGIEGLPAPLVGRDRELDLLHTTFARVCEDGAPHLVTVVGDAGVGKSRLTREFVGSLEVDAKVVVGRCVAVCENITLWPFAEILKGEAVIFENDSPGTAVAKIETLVAEAVPVELAADRELTAAALASTIGLRLPDDPLAALDPQRIHREVVAAWRALLAALAAGQPLLVVVEDLHWADESMLDLLEDLSEQLVGPVLFLGTTRPDLFRTRSGWGGGRRNFSSLALDPLTADESAELVSRLLAVDEVPADARQRILERSEGNPFFLEEIVRRLIDEGLLVYEDGRWLTREAIADIEIPDTVQGVILSRIDLLSTAERRTLQLASVIGRAFWPGAVRALGVDADLEPILRTLARRELIAPQLTSALGGDPEYMFKHVLIQDVAYETLPRRERAAAHTAMATWIENMAGERASGLGELLASHYDLAWRLSQDDELRRKARARYLDAAADLGRRFAASAAERFGRRAVELSVGEDERVEAFEALARTYLLASRGEDQYATLKEAIDEVGRDSPHFARLAARAAVVPTRWFGMLHDRPPVEELRTLIAGGLAAAGREDSVDRALLSMSRAFLQIQGYEPVNDDGRAAAQEAVAIAERLGDADVLSGALDAETSLLMAGGRYAEMHARDLRRLELVPRLTDSQEVGDAYAMAAWSAHYLGRYEEAVEHAAEGMARSAENPGTYAHCLVYRVMAKFALGDWTGALADQADIERVIEADPRGLPIGPFMRAYAVMAFCHELRGDREEADGLIDLVRRFLDEGRTRTGLVGAACYYLRALVHRGVGFDEVRRFPLTPPNEGSPILLEALCEHAAATEDWDRARMLVARAREESQATGLLALPWFADRLEGLMLRDPMLLQRSADGFASLGAMWEEAWSRLQLAELTGDPADLGPALEKFERLGSVREIVRARAVAQRPPSA
jgi:class 3 adenylate cyclase/tetratricopeptide (TPR) repeat protein